VSDPGLEYLVEVLAERGLRVEVTPAGEAKLRGPASEVTPALKDMLAQWRDQLVERFKPAGPPPPPDILTWRLGEDREWTRMVNDKKVPCVARGWKYAHEGRDAPWRELSELPPSWGFKLPEGRP
jgi:hypothetical protein